METIKQKLGESLVAEVFLAKNENTTESVFIKKIRAEFASEGIKKHIEEQRAYLLQLNIKQLIIPELQTDNDGVLLLISPCLEGQVFSKWLAKRKKLDTLTLLEIGIALTDCLAVRHKAALIHKAVKPSNVLIQENPIHIHLIDDIRVSDNSQFSRFVQDNQYRRETLPYLSPEQTGRIRFDVDCRSDLYALGTILYECATGKPPFLFDDPLAIIHSHLAEVPVPASDLNPDCPKIISDIIATLLEKAPGKRYQTTSGLCFDLQTCIASWQKVLQGTSAAHIPGFVLKQKDFINQITIPSVMMGRDQQKKKLLDEYQRVCTGKLGIAMVSGLSGMGKTRLIQEMERPIVAKRGYYTFGKFNQYNKHLPYSTMVEALSRLLRLFLTENTERISYWQKQILDAAGENGQLLVNFVPELEFLIGKQPEIIPLPPAEAQIRFNNLFCRFLACLACAEHPLVLFIDDMQWCDNATFDLLDQVISRPQDFPHLFIIGAYRNNEVNKQHRVIQMEKNIEASSQPLLKLHLDSLDKQSVNEIIAFILNTSVSQTQELTNIIYPVSVGNPLFVNESLRWLHQNKRISLSDKGDWVWDDDALFNLKLPGSAKALFYEKLKQFPVNIINILSIASLLGTRFETKDLALVTQIPQQKLFTTLSDIFTQGILLQENTFLSFFHDQIQAAAARFLDEKQKQQIHKQIARAFINQLQEKENKEDNTEFSVLRLFSIVDHLNAGHRDYANEAELVEEAHFNYRAGVAAMDALALDACDHYFSHSAKLCPDSLWQSDYDFMFTLYKKLSRAALVNGDQKRSNETISIVLKYAQSDLDRAECLYEQTVAYASLGNVLSCLESAGQALALIGETLPVSEDEIDAEFFHLIEKLHRNNRNIWREVIDAPDISGRQAILQLHLYGELSSSYYASGQVSMFNLMALRTIAVAVEKGVDDFTCQALAIMAFYFQLQDDYQYANNYEDTMLKTIKRFPNSFGSVRAMTTSLWLSLHSKYAVPDLLEFCKNNRDSAIRCGEISYAGIVRCPLLWYNFIQGKNLFRLKNQIKAFISFGQQFNLALPLGVGEALQMSLNPLWESGSIYFDKSTISVRLKLWKKLEHAVLLGCYFVFKGIVAYYNGQNSQAEQALDDGEAYLIGITNTIVYRLWYVFRYLTALQTGHKNNSKSYLEKVANWASHGPILKPYLTLMQAETIACQGDLRNIRNAYLDAIDLAHKEQYIFLEAFLNERLWQYLEKEKHFSGKTYLNRAIELYQYCGAQTKVTLLSNATQLNKPAAQLLSSGKTLLKKEQKTEIDKEHIFDKSLDYNYLLNSVKAITGELDFNKLLKIIMESAMARLGAETGYLLIAKDNGLVPYVCGFKKEQVIVNFSSDPEYSGLKLSMGIARYVFRAKKMLILNDALNTGDFVTDDVVQREKLRSVLCLPLIKQKQVLGVLYLENRLIKAVFSDDQVKIVGLLTAQAAIALQNAALLQDIKHANASMKLMNQNLELRVEERTKEISRVNEELKAFAYAVSHDLKAPLRGIIQLSSWLAEDYSDHLEKEGNEMIGLLQKRVKQMHDIIEGILQYSRIGRIKEVIVQVDLNKLVKEVAELIAIPESITFRIKGVLPVIKREETLLFQVFQNFIDNAVKYMDKEKGEINVSCINKESAWQFCVADNGPGIEEKYQKKIFKMFQTLKTKDEIDSTGIGLALIEKIIKTWGGDIWLKSEPDKGSRFFFTISKKEGLNEKQEPDITA